MSNPSPASSRTHFLLAIAAALVISIGLTSTAAIAGLVSTPRVEVRAPALLMPLAQRLAAASVLSAESAALLYAPADKQHMMAPKRRTPAAAATGASRH